MRLRRRTIAFTWRAGCKERDVAKNRNPGPVKCNCWFAGYAPMSAIPNWAMIGLADPAATAVPKSLELMRAAFA